MITMTEVEPVTAAIRLDGTVSLSEVASTFVKAPEDKAGSLPGFPKAAPPVEIIKDAVNRLKHVYRVVSPPEGSRRPLTDNELLTITRERVEIDTLLDALGARKEAISEIIRVHLDDQARLGGKRPARDAKGHYVAARPQQPFQVPVPAAGQAWSQEYRSTGVTVSTDELFAAFEAGEITRAEYLAFTRETRVLDEDKARIWMRKHQARGLEILRRITKVGRPATSLYLRKAA
jgi:hypothetical protein